MVIQRIQSLYLLIAAILMVVFACFTALSFEMPLLAGIIIFLAVIDIFLYKNLQRQMTVCFVDIIIALALIGAMIYQACVITGEPGAEVKWHWYLLLPVISVIFLMLAHKAMSNDKKKLRDADRLR